MRRVHNLVGLKTMEKNGKSTKVMLSIRGGGVQGIKRVVAAVHLRLFVFLFSCPEGFLLFHQANPAVPSSLCCRSHGVQLACWLCSERSFALSCLLQSWNKTIKPAFFPPVEWDSTGYKEKSVYRDNKYSNFPISLNSVNFLMRFRFQLLVSNLPQYTFILAFGPK